MRLGLALAHLEDPNAMSPGSAEVKPDLRYLRDAATSIAASWYLLCGFNGVDRLVFVVDGDFTIYLIPTQVIAGRVAILLHTYTKYVVGNAAGLMAPRPAVA
jgi:hypothetical protein